MSLHLFYTYPGRPPLEDSLRGNCTTLLCTGFWCLTSPPFDTIVFQFFFWSLFCGIIVVPKAWKVSEPVPVLSIMVCLNGVHVEAKGHWSITTSVTLALAFYYGSLGRGAPSPQQNTDLKRPKVRALYLCCVISFFSLLVFTIILIF